MLRLSQVAYWIRGVKDLVHVRKLFARKPGDPRGDRQRSTVGPVGEGQWPNARHVRAWEVGRRNNINEVNEQRCSTEKCGQPPAEFAEKSPSAKGNYAQTTVTSTQWLESA